MDSENKIPIPQLYWPIEDNLTPIYSNAFAAFVGPEDVVILFGDFLPTGIHFRNTKEVEDYVKTATIKPQVKIVMSISSFKIFYKVINDRMIILEKGQNGG
jgi:hypothetical protein